MGPGTLVRMLVVLPPQLFPYYLTIIVKCYQALLTDFDRMRKDHVKAQRSMEEKMVAPGHHVPTFLVESSPILWDHYVTEMRFYRGTGS